MEPPFERGQRIGDALRLETRRRRNAVQVDAGFVQEHYGPLTEVLLLYHLGDLLEDQVADEMAVVLTGVRQRNLHHPAPGAVAPGDRQRELLHVLQIEIRVLR